MTALIRPPAVAGRFYPADAAQLAADVDAALDAVPVPEDEPPAGAYVVPHAGYHYSGPTAAHAYARLRRHAGQVRRLVLVGPAHYERLAGCAAPGASAWATPLGAVPIDPAAVAQARLPVDDRPHAREHALEVQLPFVQRALPDAPAILPIAVGVETPERVAAALDRVVEPGTVVLCSTDLSHFLDLGSARQRDARTVEAMLGLAPDRIGLTDACGVYALRGLLVWAARRGLAGAVLHRSTSAEAGGDPGRVVGYAAIAFGAAGA